MVTPSKDCPNCEKGWWKAKQSWGTIVEECCVCGATGQVVDCPTCDDRGADGKSPYGLSCHSCQGTTVVPAHRKDVNDNWPTQGRNGGPWSAVMGPCIRCDWDEGKNFLLGACDLHKDIEGYEGYEGDG